MTPIAISAIILACILAGVSFGMWLATVLPVHHRNSDSKDSIRVGMALIATLTALVLGLVTASAKSSYDFENASIKRGAVDILTLDRLLARYGPETNEIRMLARDALAYRLSMTWPEDFPEIAKQRKQDGAQQVHALEAIEDRIRGLSPQTESQRAFQSKALDYTNDLFRTRWLVFDGRGSSISAPFLVIVTFWLTVLFGSFSLFAPRNSTVIAVLVVCALSVTASIFLTLEMDQPFDGVMKVSSAPLRYALSQIGQ